MTEVQIQAIPDEQGASEASVNLDMMTTKDGRKISKFSLEAMTLGDDVSKALRALF